MGFHWEMLLIDTVLGRGMEVELSQGVSMIPHDERAIRQGHFYSGAEVLELEIGNRRDKEGDGAIVNFRDLSAADHDRGLVCPCCASGIGIRSSPYQFNGPRVAVYPKLGAVARRARGVLWKQLAATAGIRRRRDVRCMAIVDNKVISITRR